MRKELLSLILLILFAQLVFHFSTSIAKPGEEKVPVRIDYILAKCEEKVLVLKSGDAKIFRAIPSPKDFSLKWLSIRFEGKIPSTLHISGWNKSKMENGVIREVYSFTGEIKIKYTGKGIFQAKIYITNVYTKRKIVAAINGIAKIDVASPPPPFSLNDLKVLVTVENFLGYRIMDIKDPNGQSLVVNQSGLPPEAVSLDPHHVMLDFSSGLKTGSYTIMIAKDKPFPSSFLVLEGEEKTYTLSPGETERIEAENTIDAKPLGWIVTIYTASTQNKVPEVEVKGDLIDHLYNEKAVFKTYAPSYLIPIISINIWVKLFIVYGNELELINRGNTAVQALTIPLYYKEVGEWVKDGLLVDIKEKDVANYRAAFLIVQIPPYGKITSINTPHGSTLKDLIESSILFGSGSRSISIAEDQLYIQVKNEKFTETGVYKVNIEWKAITVTVVDGNNRPLSGAIITLQGDNTSVTDDQGKVVIRPSHPGILDLKVTFKEVEVYSRNFIYLEEIPSTIQCQVYDLIVNVKTLLGLAVENAEVKIYRNGLEFETAYTNKSGVAYFKQLPVGEYSVKVFYRRVENQINASVYGNQEVTVTLNMLFNIPFINEPLKAEEGAIIFTATLLLGVVRKILHGKKEKEGEEYLDEDLP